MKSLFSDSKCQVVSKYFQSTTAMDDSLLDFQEKKQLNLPKKAPRSNSNAKVKLKKKLGQKDIRDAIKGKCNDLTAYTKIFDKNRKSDCVDINSEELQLAIALTRSVQNNLPNENKDSDDFVSQASKIRSTLLEYGFRAPKGKAAPAKRVLRKRKKNYKLLSIAEAERKQIITDRYTQVLFQNLNSSDASTKTVQKDLSDKPFYFVCTNILYNDIRDDRIFFIEGLIEKSTNTAGCLLKDWSKIPGRPISPCRENLDVNFKNTKCPQDKLDTILRGSLLCAKDILKSCPLIENEDYDSVVNKSNTTVKVDPKISQDYIESKYSPKIHNMDQNSQNYSEAVQSQQYRCFSPDMFDEDEVISIIDSPRKIKGTLIRHSKINTEDMNLTECVTSNFVDDKPIASDLMELTDCCGPKSQFVNAGEYNINVTPSCLNVEVTSPLTTIEDRNEKESVENVDLTQSSDEDTLPFVHISGSINKKPYVINVHDNTSNDDENNMETSSGKTNNETDFTEQEKLLQEHKRNIEKENRSSDVSIEEYLYVHSDENVNEKVDTLSGNSVPVIDEASDNCKIDLTHSSNDETLVHECYEAKNFAKQHDVSVHYDLNYFSNVNSSSLDNVNLSKHLSGKPMSQDMETINDCSNKIDATNLKSNAEDISSQNSVVFEISDTELNYSMQKSKQDNFNFGVESILHELSNDQNYKHSSESDNCYKNGDSYLPEVQVKPKTSPFKCKKEEIQLKSSNSKESTPLRKKLTDVNVGTPTNCEYLIKSDQVTPIQDYASMITPDRNKELDKYGLKPLKRKRAIQLLTHIYNQTHPIVEACLDSPSTPKKRKSNDSFSPNTSRSPKKFHENGAKQCINNLGVKEVDLYEVTSEIPLIGDLNCASEDWVFQRREKTKICSCCVPLHIAFHNYVSCRQRLRETILRYEPINIDLVHKQLAASGHKYDPKDLLRFLDKRCITVKTTDNDTRNGKK